MKITTIRPEGETQVVFYEFPNGDINTNRFPYGTSFAVMEQWGKDRQKWFEQRDIEMAQNEEEIAIMREKALMEDMIRMRVEEEFMSTPKEELVDLVVDEIIKRK